MTGTLMVIVVCVSWVLSLLVGVVLINRRHRARLIDLREGHGLASMRLSSQEAELVDAETRLAIVICERNYERAVNAKLRAALDQTADAILRIDWQQVILNEGEPCCHVGANGRACGRAKIWAGHPQDHRFISLYIFVRRLTAEAMGEKPSE